MATSNMQRKFGELQTIFLSVKPVHTHTDTHTQLMTLYLYVGYASMGNKQE